AAVDYDRAVSDWHAERARRVVTALDSLDDDEVAAFLVWGDPSLYDSTLRILERARDAGAEFSVEVVPGITAPAALTAAFGICVNRVGEPVHITTGRRLASTAPEALRNVVVMLDAHCAFRTVAGPETHIWWGAYLGAPEQILISGPALEVADEIVRVRAEARERHGGIIDSYLLRSLQWLSAAAAADVDSAGATRHAFRVGNSRRSGAPAIEAENLVKTFGDFTAVDDISFTVPTGTVLGLLGPNGAGKTTVVRMMTTLSPPTSGTARVAGHDVLREPA